MPMEGSDSIIWLALVPILLACAVANGLLWRVVRRGKRRAGRWLALAVTGMTALAAIIVMVSLEWLPWLPEDLDLDDPEAGIWQGLAFIGVNAAIILAGAALLPVAILVLAAPRAGGRA